MEWTEEQNNALEAARSWLQDPKDQVFYLAGYAGTGKSTLAKYFAENAGVVLFGAFTGKAALVMRKKGCLGATTVHKMIYLPREKCVVRLKELRSEMFSLEQVDEEEQDKEEIRRTRNAIRVETDRLKSPDFILNEESEVPEASLVVIDEVSMINERIGEDLLGFNTPVLVLGDPAQLPPVKGGGYFTNRDPDAMLKEIHRQAAGSPIIKIATNIRQGGTLEIGEYGDSRVMQRGTVPAKDLLNYDQILVGKNDTRKRVNTAIRETLEKESILPDVNDKIVCLRNNHRLGLLNGSLWTVVDSMEFGDDTVMMTILDPDTNRSFAVKAFKHYFEGREEDLCPTQMREAEHFDYGYALTVHKAQGSQWDRVLLIDESRCFRRDACRWLYTGITRAAESITVLT